MKIKTFLTALLLGSATLATAAPTTMQFDEPVYTHSSHAKQRYSGQTRDIMGFLDEKPIGKIGEIRQNGTVHISLPALRDDQLNPNIRLITAKNGKVVFMETPPEAAVPSPSPKKAAWAAR
ncbi:hypothetical protein [Kingella potus]|uniref:hypothetical protein n=1 Tax=Kingella potus TaxID=265175 RepID=UPI001FD02862|nr:hypothetical protein [Kingella potus]UOP00440.1 hypothetical protein LVJ84_11245 [Kingella potus]